MSRKRKSVDPSTLLDPNFVPVEFASGVIVDSKGLVLTDYHVLRQVEENETYVASALAEPVAHTENVNPIPCTNRPSFQLVLEDGDWRCSSSNHVLGID